MPKESRIGHRVDPRRARMRTAAVLTCAAAFLAGVVGLSLGAQAVPGDGPDGPPTPARPEATSAIDWLAAQLTAYGGALPGPDGTTTDWGVTADAVLAFTSAGRGADPAAVAATDALAANAAAFTTWTAGADTVRDAGATAKAVLVLRSTGRSADAQGVDLEAELRSLMLTTGPQAGRFSDRVPDPSWNAANGFGQAFAILALAMTDGGVPVPAVQFLLAQQCPAGGFRLTYGTEPGCTADGAADTDATALSLSALLAAPRDARVTTALERGTAWLLARQGADGSFGGTGPTAAANTNSTGLISQYLRAAGSVAAADRGAAWVSSCCQLTVSNVAGTPAAGQAGAIGYDPASRTAALNSGISAGGADQWRRTTTQAVLALGLAPYGPRDVEPLPSTSSTTTTADSSTSTSTSPTTSSTTSTSTTSSSTTSTTSTSTTSTTAAPVTEPTTTAPGPQPPARVAGAEQGSATEGATDSGSTASSGNGSTQSSSLARTGTTPAPLAVAATFLLVAGVLLCAMARRGRASREDRGARRDHR